MKINKDLVNFTNHLVSISDFSKGKTAKIFDDVRNNNHEYIILKNNQPTAILLSLEMYRDITDKATKMETLLEKIEEIRLLKLAEHRMKSFDQEATIDHDDLAREMGFDPAEIEKDCESVDIE